MERARRVWGFHRASGRRRRRRRCGCIHNAAVVGVGNVAVAVVNEVGEAALVDNTGDVDVVDDVGEVRRRRRAQGSPR